MWFWILMLPAIGGSHRPVAGRRVPVTDDRVGAQSKSRLSLRSRRAEPLLVGAWTAPSSSSRLAGEQLADRVIHRLATARRSSTTSTPRPSCGSVCRSTSRALDEPVDAVGHRAARHQRLLQQRLRAELVRRARAAQRGQHVELPRLEIGCREGRRAAPGRGACDSRATRDSTCIGEKSTSGRSRDQSSTMRSTSSLSGIPPLSG